MNTKNIDWAYYFMVITGLIILSIFVFKFSIYMLHRTGWYQFFFS